jgi:cell division GTPase FtsZ
MNYVLIRQVEDKYDTDEIEVQIKVVTDFSLTIPFMQKGFTLFGYIERDDEEKITEMVKQHYEF